MQDKAEQLAKMLFYMDNMVEVFMADGRMVEPAEDDPDNLCSFANASERDRRKFRARSQRIIKMLSE